MKFRSDINALRAFAVLSVVLFHFKVDGFSGGFIGVDIFFAISGFLMTGIIFGALQEDRFSLVDFYLARARRIIPALVVLCGFLAIFGFVYLPLDDFRELLRTIKSALLFNSNFKFSETGDYFSLPLHENWLLHTWSLSVEWQFYLIYPVLALALYKYFGLHKTRLALVWITGISFAASVILSSSNPINAFYMLPTRVWELTLGGLIFLFPLRTTIKTGRLLEILGAGLILFSTFYLDSSYAWPGYWALLPVAGTALVLYGNSNLPLFNWFPIQLIGKTSYSIYLWHWPLVVLLYLCGMLNNAAYVTSGIGLSLLLGALSYQCIEKKVKKAANRKHSAIKYSLLVIGVVASAATLSSLVKKHPHIRFAFEEPAEVVYTSKLYDQNCRQNEWDAADCQLDTGPISVIIYGDSHAQATAAAVQIGNDKAALSWALGGCPTLMNFNMRDKDKEKKCRAFNDQKIAILGAEYPGVPVVLLSRTGLYADTSRENSYSVTFDDGSDFKGNYIKTVCKIATTHPVYIVKPIPEMPFNINKGLYLKNRLHITQGDISLPIDEYFKRNTAALAAMDAAKEQCGAKLLDPLPMLCPQGKCMGSENGIPLYFDDNHLIDLGNQKLAPLFEGIFKSNGRTQSQTTSQADGA